MSAILKKRTVATSNKDARAEEAQARRNLEGNTTFEHLGKPIQKLLQQVTKGVTDQQLQLFSKVTVKQLAKVFDMLGQEEDPDKILMWLTRDARRQQGLEEEEKKARRNNKKKDSQTQDAIAFYRELEKKNLELMETIKKQAAEREQVRAAAAVERKKRRTEAAEKKRIERERAIASGVDPDKKDATEKMKESAIKDIANTFDGFASKKSAADNSGAAQDTEWWKKDEYRREWEKAGKKGKSWNRVVEGGSASAPDSELAAREEWFKSQCWWKSDKHRSNYQATKDADWWKEEPYIRDWQDNGDKGARWVAADEVSGFNRRGDHRRAADIELARRAQWYQNNGPKGIVKTWCALAEGSFDRCTLEEKREREAYFKSGEWWKSERQRRKLIANPEDCDAIKFSGAAGEDREWWKDEKYRRDFNKGGKQWKAASEKAAAIGADVPCTEGEAERREEWFKDNWWKADTFRNDWKKNGDKGKVWKARDEAEAKKPDGGKPCSAADLRQREDWFKSAEDREWWKDEAFMRDWEAHGNKGAMWTAAWKEAGLAHDGQKDGAKASAEELQDREKWFKNNWWKADKYVKDFQSNGAKGTAWKAKKNDAFHDKDWWKQGEYTRKWAAAKKANPEPFWQAPEYIDDYLKNGTAGKKWNAANAAAGSCGKGDQVPATTEELAEREAFFKKNWWRGKEAVADYASEGNAGKIWTAKGAPGTPEAEQQASTEELRERANHFNPHWKRNANPAFAAMLEADATQPPAGEMAGYKEIANREESYKRDWWKRSKAIKDDVAVNGAKSKLLKAATAEVAALGLADDEKYQASPAEIEKRLKHFQSGDADKPKEWWEDEGYQKEYASGRDPDFWKNPECIEDFLKNGKAGKKWQAANAAAASVDKAQEAPCSAEEQAEREQWFQDNFWKAPEYKEDFEKNGQKGTKWTTTQPNGKGQTVSEAELKARQAYFKPKARWQLKEQPEENATALQQCSPAEAAEREQWFEDNWWKTPEAQEDVMKHGKKSKYLKAKTADVVALGLEDDEKYQASPAEMAERQQWFDNQGEDNDWWKDPAVVADYVKNGEQGATWQARTQKEGDLSMGKEAPASEAELAKRKQWFAKNFWKTPEAIEDFAKNGNKGSKWALKSAGDEEGAEKAPEDELAQRRQWFEEHQAASPDEVAERQQWFEDQLTDEEKIVRRNWMQKQAEEQKRINVAELRDVLTSLNDGEKPSDEQIQAIEEYVKKKKLQRGGFGAATNPNADATITQEEFVDAIADTAFYVEKTDEEKLRQEQEALEAMQMEEMLRAEEEAAFMSLEMEEELEAAGQTYEELKTAEAAEKEEEAYLAQMEEQDALEAHVNEDDQQLNEEDESAWQDFLENQDKEGGDNEEEELTEEEAAKLADAEEQRLQAELAQKAAEDAAWESEEFGGEEWEEEVDGDEAVLDEDAKEELEALVDDDGAEQWEDGEEQWEEEEVIDEMQQEEKGQPMQWKLPLPEVTNPQFLKSYFTVVKYTPSHSLFGGKQKRIWVCDHFTRTFYNLDKGGKVKKEHAANKLLQLERHVSDTSRLRLMFFDASHSYELQFHSPQERERFYETSMAIRPSIRVYSPDLTNQDQSVEACTTTIDGVGPNAVTVTCNNASGKPVARELTGECKINASKLLTEPLTIWCGTFNLSGHHPPRSANEFAEWMPKDKYDIYAVAVQEASYRKEEGEWFEYVQNYLGKEYLTLASMNLWDTLLIVLSRKKHLLKITNVEGSTKATVHKSVCGTKGGIGISLRYLETSMAFITCHLAARLERNAMRNTNIEEIVDGLQLGVRETDFCNQFNHCFFFGDLNYRVELDQKQADEMMAAKQWANMLEYDQLTTQRRDEGVLHGFQEPPITFAPTYRMQVGVAEGGKYMAEKGNAPSYCDRVLTRSMANTWVKCTGYRAFPKVSVSEHQPVNATFIVRCVRPTMSCFMKQQSPIPLFRFQDIQFVESTGPMIKKPVLMIASPFTGSTPQIEAVAGNTASPQWSQAKMPKLESVTQAQEYLETCHIVLVVREAAEKREDKSHRGTALITLFGRVLGVQDVQQEFESDILCHGRCLGKLKGTFHWEAAPLV